MEKESQMSAPEPVNPGLTPADMETMAEAVHDAYLETCARLGWGVKPENQVPYSALSEDSKELDRASVRAVLRFVAPKGRTFWIEASEAEGKTFYGQIYAHPGPGRIQMVEVQPAKAPPESPKGAREAVARICCDVFNKARGEEAMADDWLLFTGEADKIFALVREVLPPESETAKPTPETIPDQWCPNCEYLMEDKPTLDPLDIKFVREGLQTGVTVEGRWQAQAAFERIIGAKPGARDTLPTSKEANQIVDGLLTDQHRKERASTPIEGAGDTVEGATSPYYPTKVEAQVVDEGRRGYFGVDVAITLPTPGGNLYLAKGYFSRMPEGAARIIAEYLARPSTPLTGTQEAATPWNFPKPDCDLCKGSGFYGDRGPGRKGNAEYIRCDCTQAPGKEAGKP